MSATAIQPVQSNVTTVKIAMVLDKIIIVPNTTPSIAGMRKKAACGSRTKVVIHGVERSHNEGRKATGEMPVRAELETAKQLEIPLQ